MGIVRYTVANGQILAESRDGVAKRYVGDPLGSTAALVDTTGAITDTFTYWPYGEERTRTGSTPTPFRFGGRSDTTNAMQRSHTSVPALSPPHKHAGQHLTPSSRSRESTPTPAPHLCREPTPRGCSPSFFAAIT